jgi:DNA repair exonuclease SbcCD nuclease subunit
MRILRVGDPHVKPSNIEESERLLEYALSIAGQQNVDRIEILGDLFHTHAIVRLEVLEFWGKWLKRLGSSGHDLVVLVGNHDLSGDHNSDAHALKVFSSLEDLRTSHRITIVDKPITKGIYGYLPYYHNPEHFLTSARYLATNEDSRVLVCHQTLGGAQYENGFYAPDAIDPAGIPYDTIISGHIHKYQIIESLGKTIIYPGTPRWDTLSDANEQKGIWVYEHNDITGKVESAKLFSTHEICSPIVSLIVRQGEHLPDLSHFVGSRLHVELVGTSDWVKAQRDELKGKASVKVQITDARQTRMKSGTHLIDFIIDVYQAPQEEKLRLVKYMKENGLV